jgi:hypothetical protein
VDENASNPRKVSADCVLISPDATVSSGSRATEKARRRARLITVEQPIYTSERRRIIKLLG